MVSQLLQVQNRNHTALCKPILQGSLRLRQGSLFVSSNSALKFYFEFEGVLSGFKRHFGSLGVNWLLIFAFIWWHICCNVFYLLDTIQRIYCSNPTDQKSIKSHVNDTFKLVSIHTHKQQKMLKQRSFPLPRFSSFSMSVFPKAIFPRWKERHNGNQFVAAWNGTNYVQSIKRFLRDRTGRPLRCPFGDVANKIRRPFRARILPGSAKLLSNLCGLGG